jgi:hypothetical protein
MLIVPNYFTVYKIRPSVYKIYTCFIYQIGIVRPVIMGESEWC